MLNLNGGENLEMSVVVFGISGLYDLSEITIWSRDDLIVFENAKILTLGVKDRTVGAHGKRYVSVIRQHSSADTLVVA